MSAAAGQASDVTGRWSKEEHDAFLQGLRTVGNKWKEIHDHFVPTRSVVQIRTHAQKYFLRVAKEQGIDPKQISVGEDAVLPSSGPLMGMQSASQGADGSVSKAGRLAGSVRPTEVPYFPDVTVRHVFLEPDMSADSIGISLKAATPFVVVDALPRLIVRHEGGREEAVQGVAEESKSVLVGDFVMGVCGVTTHSLPPAAVGSMISAVRSATRTGSVVVHLSDRLPVPQALPLALQHMQDAAAALLGELTPSVMAAAQEARQSAVNRLLSSGAVTGSSGLAAPMAMQAGPPGSGGMSTGMAPQG